MKLRRLASGENMAEAVGKKVELRVIAPTMATDKSPYKFNKPVDMVIMRCSTGDIGILPNRMPISMVLGNGVLRIFDEDEERHMAILGGVAHAGDNIITILSDAAYKSDEIDAGKISGQMAEFRRLMDETADLGEKQKYRDDIHRMQVQLDVAGAEVK
ncbi:MAG: ATP synthase F1 subunit epsilon [Defluviitaleaceae bacterium]|nr:ATP synthase F1 subunit epsilon [Defluviitaleaceae bacterium]